GHQIGIRLVLLLVTIGRTGAGAGTGASNGDQEQDEAYSDLVAQRNLVVAAVTFFLGLMLTIPFGLWVMSEIRDASEAGRQARAESDTAALVDTDVQGSTGGADDVAGGGSNRAGSGASGDSSTRAQQSTQSTRPLPLTLSQALDRLDDDFRAEAGLPDHLLEQFGSILLQARASWVQYDSSSRTRVLRFVLDVMCDKGDDGNAAAALIERIAPDPPTPWDAASVPEYAWSVGVLGMLMGDVALPGPARQQTESRWQRLTGRSARSEQTNTQQDFSQAAQHGLQLVAADLMTGMQADSVDDARVLLWNAWIQTNRALHQHPEAVSRVLIGTAYELLSEGPELRANETANRVLVALLSEADLIGTLWVRTEIARWFSDPRVSPSDLNLVTSYLVSSQRISGLDTTHIVDTNANSSERSRYREQLLAAWPSTGSDQSNVGPAIADWLVRAERSLLRSSSGQAPEQQLAEVLQMAHLNEAAAWLELGRTDLAETVLADSRRVSASAGAQNLLRSGRRAGGGGSQRGGSGNQATERPNVSFGADGQWTILVEQALRRNDRQRTIDLIQWLSIEAGNSRLGLSDLGPVDAAKLVNLAVYGLNRVIRAEALSAIEEQYADGYTVVLALADAIPPDRKDSALSRTVEEIIQASLPVPGSPDWYGACRAGLLSHALNLRGPTVTAARIDGLARHLGFCYDARTAASAEWTAIGYGLPVSDTPSSLRASTSPRSQQQIDAADPKSQRRRQPTQPSSTGSKSDTERGPQSEGTASAGTDSAATEAPDPATSVSSCRDSWMMRARRLSPTRPIPAELGTVQSRQEARLQLAEDPISVFAAQQYGLLELMAYVTAAERPAVSDSLMEILATALRDRAQADSVIRQLMVVEQAITEVWMIRLLQSHPRGERNA
ncbi:MAG: hypothetical protein D8M59_00005, partial [Planctomycetes bacterium]|nr:hypothetical protein [Planctomycetota bacterium]